LASFFLISKISSKSKKAFSILCGDNLKSKVLVSPASISVSITKAALVPDFFGFTVFFL
jgi:hypothetical protein